MSGKGRAEEEANVLVEGIRNDLIDLEASDTAAEEGSAAAPEEERLVSFGTAGSRRRFFWLSRDAA